MLPRQIGYTQRIGCSSTFPLVMVREGFFLPGEGDVIPQGNSRHDDEVAGGNMTRSITCRAIGEDDRPWNLWKPLQAKNQSHYRRYRTFRQWDRCPLAQCAYVATSAARCLHHRRPAWPLDSNASITWADQNRLDRRRFVTLSSSATPYVDNKRGIHLLRQKHFSMVRDGTSPSVRDHGKM